MTKRWESGEGIRPKRGLKKRGDEGKSQTRAIRISLLTSAALIIEVCTLHTAGAR